MIDPKSAIRCRPRILNPASLEGSQSKSPSSEIEYCAAPRRANAPHGSQDELFGVRELQRRIQWDVAAERLAPRSSRPRPPRSPPRRKGGLRAGSCKDVREASRHARGWSDEQHRRATARERGAGAAGPDITPARALPRSRGALLDYIEEGGSVCYLMGGAGPQDQEVVSFAVDRRLFTEYERKRAAPRRGPPPRWVPGRGFSRRG